MREWNSNVKRFIVFGTVLGLGGSLVIAGLVGALAGPMIIDMIEDAVEKM